MSTDMDAEHLGAETAGAADDATEVVTQIGVQLDKLAYSSEEPRDADVKGSVSRPWREAWAGSAVFVFIAALAAFVVAHTDVHVDAPTSTTMPASKIPPITAPPTTPALTDKDQAFLQALRNVGITNDHPAQILFDAQWVCGQFRQGVSRDDIVAREKATNPDATDLHAFEFVNTAAEVYCPEFAR
jgi:Protein of unknown function (DUF732)